MQVKNIVINNIEIFMDELIRTLIKHEISYVRIDNEIHFDNYIYRFYELENSVESIPLIDLSFLCAVPKEIKFIDRSSEEDIINRSFISHDRSFTSLNKKKIKAQNRINNRLVNTSRKK